MTRFLVFLFFVKYGKLDLVVLSCGDVIEHDVSDDTRSSVL